MRPRVEKALLVNYAGYVLTANTFIPDSSLAILAAVLERDGIGAEILDYQNARDIGDILDGEDPTPADALWTSLRAGRPIDEELFAAYRDQRSRAEAAFEERQIERVCARIAADRVGLVGFKLWAGTGLWPSIRMARAIRRRFPEVLLVAGGPAVRYAQELVFELTDVFDYLIYGDGELPLLELARGQRDGVPGTIGSRGVVPSDQRYLLGNLDEVPAGAYGHDVYPNLADFFAIRVIDESRGCFNRCSFCSHRFISGATRKRDPKLVVDEIEHAYRAQGVRYFRFSGSNPPYKHLLAIAREITRRRLPVKYSAYASMNNLKAEYLPELAESGLAGLLFGLESGDRDYLRRVHSKDNGASDEIVRALGSAMKSNVFVAISLIVPSPFESPETKAATKSLIARIFEHHCHGSVVVFPALLAPGSQWWDRMDDYGFEFLPGFDKKKLTLSLLDWDPFFMLPRSVASTLGYSLNGKRSDGLFAECEAFMSEIGALGIPTNVDDAAYMLAHMAKMSPGAFKADMLRLLLKGGPELGEFVAKVNASGSHPSLGRSERDPVDVYAVRRETVAEHAV